MTQEEFLNTRFSAGMKVKHNKWNEIYDVESVDFIECLIGVPATQFSEGSEDGEIQWFRCENCTIIED